MNGHYQHQTNSPYLPRSQLTNGRTTLNDMVTIAAIDESNNSAGVAYLALVCSPPNTPNRVKWPKEGKALTDPEK